LSEEYSIHEQRYRICVAQGRHEANNSEHLPAYGHWLCLLPPIFPGTTGGNLPELIARAAFRCHERSPTIPRIGRVIAAILPEFVAKPFTQNRRDCSQ
jgi:hypothetical protein